MSSREAEITFIQAHLHLPIPEVALLLSKRGELDKDYVLRQLNGRKKAGEKFPFLDDLQAFEFPSSRAVAQASSMATARFKASLLAESHQTLADLSGGMGIDALFMSEGRQKLYYIEPNADLFKISKANFKALDADQIECINCKAIDFIEKNQQPLDLIYLDPDRRKDDRRMIRLEDCQPDILELQKELFKQSNEIMLKFSPLVDIKLAVQQLCGVKEVVVVSLKNECKELLFRMHSAYEGETIIRAIDLEVPEIDFRLTQHEEETAVAEYGEPLDYLYEPNAAIMKAGAFKLLAQRLRLRKIAKNTHLYTSQLPIESFPGRKLKIIDQSKSPKIAPKKINLVNRNSGLSVAEMKKRYKLKDGGDQFLYAFRNNKGKRAFILADRI